MQDSLIGCGLVNAKLHGPRPFKKSAHLFEGVELSVIHDGFHPSIMNRNWIISVSISC